MANYWDKVLQKRIGRRRALIGAGGTAFGAAFLAACGGDDDDDGGGANREPASDFYQIAQDTTSDATHGGTLTWNILRDPANFDYYNFDPGSQTFANVTGAKLFRIKPGKFANASGEVEPDLAESFELSEDKLTLTVKLHPNAKFSPFSSQGFHSGVPASVEGRKIDADDVVFSWNRLITTPSAFGGGAGELSNELDPDAPITSVTAIDSETVQFKMARPHAPLMTSLAYGSVSFLYIIPKEGANDGIDFLQTQIGGGPFFIDRYEPSVGMTLKRNPYFEERWSDPNLPFVDQVDLVVLPDIAAATAQFRAGVLLEAPQGVTLDDRFVLNSEIDDLVFYESNIDDGDALWFGFAADSLFTDIRLRQAMSYAWDRDAYIRIIRAVDKLEANGVPPNMRWNTCFHCYRGWDGWWLDPQGSDFGENAKWYTLGEGRDADIAEAKKLINAATGADEMEVTHVVGQLNAAQPYAVDVLDGIMREAGFLATSDIKTYSDFLSTHRNPDRPLGDWTGIATTGRYSPAEPSQMIRAYFHPKSNRWLGASPNPPWPSAEGDPFMNETMTKLWEEFDQDARIELFHEFQRYHAEVNYLPLFPGGATDLVLAWPGLGNPGIDNDNWLVYKGSGQDINYVYNWLDMSKAPFA